MRLKILDLTCPKCGKAPSIKKVDTLIQLKCRCISSAGWQTFYYALSSWIIKIGEKGSFKDYEQIIKNSDL